jgi:hypothetical protein
VRCGLASPALRRHLTRPFLGRSLRIRSADPDAGRYLTDLLGDDPDGNLRLALDDADAGSVSVVIADDQPIGPFPVDEAPAQALAALNRRLCFGPGPHLVIHCAVVAREGQALLLHGRSGAGKSTLASGLVRAGWTYLSDEGAGLDATGRVQPYTRPIMLQPSSWPLFPELRGRLPAGHERFATDEWHVPPALLGAVADAPARPRAAVDVRFERGAPTELAPIGRGEALEAIVYDGCNLRFFGQAGLERLRDVVLACRCYRLVYGDLEEAVAALATVELSG